MKSEKIIFISDNYLLEKIKYYKNLDKLIYNNNYFDLLQDYVKLVDCYIYIKHKYIIKDLIHFKKKND